MTYQNNNDPSISTDSNARTARGEQRSYAGWVIGAVALIAVALAAIFVFPHQTLDKGSINSDQSKAGAAPVTTGSSTGTAPGTNPSAPVNPQR